MYTKAIQFLSFFLQRKLRAIFTIILAIGILLGARLSYAASSSVNNLTCMAGNGTLTLLGLIAVLLIPLTLSLIVFCLRIPLLILPIVFLKSVAFAFSCCCVMLAYGDGGWLVRFFLLFSDSAMFVVLCWYWLSHLDGSNCRLKQNTIICFGLAAVIGIVDYIYVSPFWAMLI